MNEFFQSLTQTEKVQILASFLGAFFAFMFLIMSDRYKRYIERRNKCINEHVYLERYFDHLLSKLIINEQYVLQVKSSFSKTIIDMTRFQSLPLRFEAEMNLLDIPFLNSYHTFLIDLVKLNEAIMDANKQKDKINRLIEKYCIDEGTEKQKEFVEKSTTNYASVLGAFHGYFKKTQDDLFDLYSVNRYMLRYYKYFIMKRWSFRFIGWLCPHYRVAKINECRKEYETELKGSYRVGLEKYKRYNIIQ